MIKSSVSTVKREQKTSFLLKEVAALVQEISMDEPKLLSVFVTYIVLSKDGGICYVYFSTYTNKEAFDEALEILKLYKPSMRKALATTGHSRYVPNLRFLYDESKEKERHINKLLDDISTDK
jgi:ribosome-binding factor A